MGIYTVPKDKPATMMVKRDLIALSLLVFLTTSSMAYPMVEYVYHNYDHLTEILGTFQQMYPELCDLYSIGQSVDERELWVIAISGANPDHHTVGIPEVKYVGNMHGNEVIGREMLLHFVEELLSMYGHDEEITTFLDRTRVHILPTMNPDGFEDAAPVDCTGVQGRYNRNGYDINRNFPDFFEENSELIQLETRAIMNWLESEQFILSANLHGGALLANYPYDNLTPEEKQEYRDKYNNTSPYSECPDDDIFRYISLMYSQSHFTMHQLEENKCDGDYWSFEGFEEGITNGADWYPTTGCMQDYNYIYHGCLEITLELSCCKYPSEDTLEGFWMENRRPLLNYLQQVHRGVTGIVYDSFGRPIPDADVIVVGRDNKFPFKTNSNGEYWRMLLPGEYTLQVGKEDFVIQKQDVLVSSYIYNVEQADFYLEAVSGVPRIKINVLTLFIFTALALKLSL